MYKAIDIANWFLLKNNSEVLQHEAEGDDYEVYEGITHLKLQKLLYYAQGVYLASTGEKLFEEDIEAWTHGPVVQEVYEVFRTCGKNNIIVDLDEKELDVIRDIENNAEVSEILNAVYDNFAIYTAWQLREMSHELGGPWDKTVKAEKKVIDLLLIKDYFTREILTNE